MSPIRREATTVLRVPAGLAGPDVDALRRLVRTELARPEVRRLEIDLRATTSARRLAPFISEVRPVVESAGISLAVVAPAHPAARREFERRLIA